VNYKTGDPVWVLFTRPDLPQVKGQWISGTVLGMSLIMPERYLCEAPEVPVPLPHLDDDYEGGWRALPSHMKPRKPPEADKVREEVGEWELCPWRPRELQHQT
jgi:hypothetical protein